MAGKVGGSASGHPVFGGARKPRLTPEKQPQMASLLTHGLSCTAVAREVGSSRGAVRHFFATEARQPLRVSSPISCERMRTCFFALPRCRHCSVEG